MYSCLIGIIKHSERKFRLICIISCPSLKGADSTYFLNFIDPI